MKHMASEVFSLLSKVLRQEVEGSTWERATEIQVLAIPRILKGESVLLIAPTGTGKTEAVVYPVFEQFLRTRLKHPLNGISILYITPPSRIEPRYFQTSHQNRGKAGHRGSS